MAPRKKPEPFRRKNAKVYYFCYWEGDKRIYKSTGETLKYKAVEFIEDFLGSKDAKLKNITLREYIEPFYDWDRCPHVRRLREENKSITEYHAKNERARITNHILPDPIADMVFTEIRRSDILDFRSRIKEKEGAPTASKVLKVLKTVFNEADYREDIDRNPAESVGDVKYDSEEAGIFTREELFALFPEDSVGPWMDVAEYTCFFLAATTGMRRGEILALHWYNVNLVQKELMVLEAFKGTQKVIGLPKWDKVRGIALADILVKKLKEYKELTGASDGDFVFRYIGGRHKGKTYGGTKWQDAFVRALKKLNIDKKARCLIPHSLRHSLQTLLRASGQDSEKLRDYFGWTNEKTQKGYTHINASHLRPEADAIDNLFSNE